MSLTGLTWSFAWYRTGFYKIFGVETRQGSGHAAHGQEKKGKENHRLRMHIGNRFIDS